MPTGVKHIINPGDTFGRLTVLEETIFFRKPSGQTCRQFICKCTCGSIKKYRLNDIKSGNTKSCGCFNKEVIKTPKKHGYCTGGTTPEYRVWRGIKSRCYNIKESNYERYGGRGITMCETWINDFTQFLSDMGARPSPLYSIERKNNQLGYFKENCYWATIDEQNNNTRANRRITLNGVTLNISQWAKKTGLARKTIAHRIDRYGWSIEDSLTKPVMSKR